MKRRLCLAVVICLSVFVLGAYAADKSVGVFVPVTEGARGMPLTKGMVTTSDDVPDIIEKNLTPPKISAFVGVPFVYGKSIGNSAKINST